MISRGTVTETPRLVWVERIAFAQQRYRCVLISAPVLSLLAFAVMAYGQVVLVGYLRKVRRDVAAFAVLLLATVTMMFLMGETMALDHFRKGLAHFQKDRVPIFSITETSHADFVFDYARHAVVLKDPPRCGGGI